MGGVRIAGDALGDFRIGDAQPQRLRALVQDDLGDEFADDGAVIAARACLLHAEWLAEAATELLQPIIVDLAELLDGDLGAADLGEGGAAKAAKNVADSPDREADHEETDHGGHDDLAEPVGRGFAQTSKHAGYRVVSEAQTTGNAGLKAAPSYGRARCAATDAAARRRLPGAALARARALW